MASDFYSDNIHIQLLKYDEVVQAVQELDNFQTQQKAVKKGFSDAGRFLVRKGRLRLRQRMKSGSQGVTGNLLRSFTYRIKKKSENCGVIIGFKRNRSEGKLGYHAHLVSEGTRERFYKGKSRGRMTPNYFWSDTRRDDIEQARLLVMQGIQSSIQIIKNRYNA